MAGNIVPRSDGGSNLGTASKEFNVIYAKSFGGTIASQIVTTNSPIFTGTPAAPTAATGTNTTQISTTAFANSAASAAASSAVATHNAAPDAHSGIIASAISTHNSANDAHSDIRTAITTAVSTHNSAAGAHSDIRSAISGKADSSALAAYLPLAGGTLTGAVGFSGTTNKITASGDALTWAGKNIYSGDVTTGTSTTALSGTNSAIVATIAIPKAGKYLLVACGEMTNSESALLQLSIRSYSSVRGTANAGGGLSISRVMVYNSATTQELVASKDSSSSSSFICSWALIPLY